jgi:hypothetical protein
MGVGKEVVADSGAAIDDYVRQQHCIAADFDVWSITT